LFTGVTTGGTYRADQLNRQKGEKMKKLVLSTVVMLALSIGGAALAEDKAPAAKPATKKDSVKRERTVTATAIVQAINLDKRIVTLKGPEGKVFDLKVGEEARNLPQVKVGDEVTVKYYESIAYRLLKPGEAPVPTQEAVVAGRAKPGEKPAGLVGQEMTITATIEAIDTKAQTATLKGPEGRSFTVKAQDPKNLTRVKVGDQVVITYTEAFAIAVEPAKKK
jgi:hypothetical protein